jgi:hypothetical protein
LNLRREVLIRHILDTSKNLNLKFLTLPDFVGGSKDELEALKARQIIARDEASEASVTPGHLAKLIRALKGRKIFSRPFRAWINPLLYQGLRSLRSLHPWLLSIALSALPKRDPQNPTGSENFRF